MNYRAGEQEKVWFRSERIFTVGENCYASTREGELGPFVNKQSAHEALAIYINLINQDHCTPDHAAQLACKDTWDKTGIDL